MHRFLDAYCEFPAVIVDLVASYLFPKIGDILLESTEYIENYGRCASVPFELRFCPKYLGTRFLFVVSNISKTQGVILEPKTNASYNTTCVKIEITRFIITNFEFTQSVFPTYPIGYYTTNINMSSNDYAKAVRKTLQISKFSHNLECFDIQFDSNWLVIGNIND